MKVRHSTWIAVLAVVATALATGWLASSAGARSVHSAIVCPIGWADANMLAADGCETNLAVDLWNCGRLNNPVPVGGRCVNGVPLDAKGKPVVAEAAASAATTTTTAAPAPAAPASGSPPSTLDFTTAHDPHGSFDGLGKSQGDPSCSGTGAALVCVEPMGSKGSFVEDIPVRDNATGASGTMTVECSWMYEGVTTTYADRQGKGDATGSQDCTIAFAFGKDGVSGSMHEQRVLVANHETATMVVTFTGGSGRYAGFQGTLTFSRTQDWTPPEPIGQSGQGAGSKDPGAARTTQVHSTAAASLRGLAGRVTVKRATRPVVDIATVGLLVPSNRSFTVKAVAAPGSTCSIRFTGTRPLTLAPVVADAKGVATFPTVAAGSFPAKAALTAVLSCRADGSRVAAMLVRHLRAFAVLGL